MEHVTYIKHTESKTVVLFIHGFLGSPNHFQRFLQVVPEHCAIYNLLLKGHGGTVLDFAQASMKEWKEQVRLVVDQLAERYEEIIICAHSMGTFFALEQAVKHPERIKSLYLLAIPLRIAVKTEACINTLKTFFHLMPEGDEKGEAYKTAHGVELNKRLWEYIGWVPRYLELFAESKRSRETIQKVTVPCQIFYSKKDELVSMRSEKDTPIVDNVTVHVLPNSAHFIYSKSDYDYLLDEFGKLF